MPAKDIVEYLTTITDSFFQEDDDSHFFGTRLYIPRQITQEHEIDEMSALVLTEDEANLYSRCLARLADDRTYEHLDVRQLKDALTEIIWDVYVRRDELRGRRERFRAIRAGLDDVAKPLETYRFLFAINHLETIESPLNIGRVTFQVLTDELVEYWTTIRPNVDESRLPAPAGGVVAIVEEEGASLEKAVARAGGAVDDALDELRIAVSRFKIRIWDNELRFSRGAKYAATVLPEEDSFYTGWRNLRNQPLNLTGPLFQSTTEKLEALSFVRNDEVSPKMRTQLLRAIGWMGQSTVRENEDDKVVDLCTALECLLTTRRDIRKGEAIALRSMALSKVLDDGFIHPSETLRLYDLRSRVIHGSDRYICSNNDYRSLKRLCTIVLDQIIEILKRDHSISRPSRLFETLSDPEILGKCIEWLDAQENDTCNELSMYARQYSSS